MKETRSIRFAATSVVSIAASCVLAGSAFAADVSVGGTSNNTDTQINISNDSSTTYTNDSNVSVTNTNSQSVSSGAVSESDVAQGGNLSSGTATAQNSTTTSIDQAATPIGGMGGGSGSSSGSSGGGMGGGSGTGDQSTGGMGGGSGTVGGGMGGAVATLPDTGASVPVDVSALRALYHAPTAQTVVQAAKQAGITSAVMLGVAGLLSLIGAAGSAIHVSRRSKLGLQ